MPPNLSVGCRSLLPLQSDKEEEEEEDYGERKTSGQGLGVRKGREKNVTEQKRKGREAESEWVRKQER